MSEQEYTESGDPIYRYGDKEESRNWIPPVNMNEEQTEAIEAHIERHIGKIDSVYHEIMSETVHIDVQVVPPTAEKNYYTLLTTGMSDLPMNVPDELENADEFRYAELMISLPPDWPLQKEALTDEDHNWPVNALKFLARFPHEYDTFLTIGHSIPNGDPAAPIADNVNFIGFVIGPPLLVDDNFQQLKTPDGKIINFYALYPVYQEEMNVKLKKGIDKLAALFNKHQVTELVNVNRPCVVDDKPWWKPF